MSASSLGLPASWCRCLFKAAETRLRFLNTLHNRERIVEGLRKPVGHPDDERASFTETAELGCEPAPRHPDALAVQADVIIGGGRMAMLQAVADRFGRLDILIGNAGTFVVRDFAAGADARHDLEQEVALNLTAPIQLMGEVLNRWPI